MSENDRKKIENIGYNHPTEIILNNRGNKKYKTFNNDSKEIDYVSSQIKSKYAKFTDEKSQKICPECQEVALMECNCEKKDKQCSNGHIWYFNTNGSIIKGDPHD